MTFEFAEELNSKQSVKSHEEDEEQRHVVDLLTRTPKMKFN